MTSAAGPLGFGFDAESAESSGSRPSARASLEGWRQGRAPAPPAGPRPASTRFPGAVDQFDLPLTPAPEVPVGRKGLGFHVVITDTGEDIALRIHEVVHDASGLQPRNRIQGPPPRVHAHEHQERFGNPLVDFPERFVDSLRSSAAEGSFRCHPASSPPVRRRSVICADARRRSLVSKYSATNRCSTGVSTRSTPGRSFNDGKRTESSTSNFRSISTTWVAAISNITSPAAGHERRNCYCPQTKVGR